MTHLAHRPNLDPPQPSPLATPISFNLLSLTSGTALSATSSLIPSHFSPTPPVLTRPAAPRARLMGRPVARPAQMPSQRERASSWRIFRGEDPLTPLATPAGAPPAKGTRSRRPLSRASNPMRRTLLPLRRLGREAYTPRPGIR
jgi:hypothetical protein